jgi:antitoxin StbD
MKHLLAHYSASITELKNNPSALLDQAGGAAIAILNHNSPTAYLVPAEMYEALLEQIEDYELGLIIKARQTEKSKAVKVSLDDL